MEQAMLWVAIIGILLPIILGFIGWIFNALITRKIDDLQKENDNRRKEIDDLKEGITSKAKEGFTTVFKRIDDLKLVMDTKFKESEDHCEKTYVRDSEYKIHREYQEKDVDQKFKSMIGIINTQFENVETKTDSLKDLINNKVVNKPKID